MNVQYGTIPLSNNNHGHSFRVSNHSKMRRILAIFVTTIATCLSIVGLVTNGRSNVPLLNLAPAVECYSSSFGNPGEFLKTQSLSTPQQQRPWTFLNRAQNQEEDVLENRIQLDLSRKYQTILGFGGAFTEASAIHFANLLPQVQQELLDLYFGPEGSRYTLGRIPLNSCDFSPRSYNFDNASGDDALQYFDTSVAHDTETMIPFIRRALGAATHLRLFTSPWSPPAWMKNGAAPGNMTTSAKPNGLAVTHQQTWARYISKFISAYAAHGVPLWGLTVQNEPEFDAPWEACEYTVEYTAEFIKRYLGPTLARDHADIQIMAYDHNRPDLTRWTRDLYADPEVAQYVSGMAFHWYSNTFRELDGMNHHANVEQAYHIRPDKFVLSTESSNCPGVASDPALAWYRAQRYAHDIISDLNHFAAGWVDWNLILDTNGGPNHLNNTCDAPILITSDRRIKIQPMYYFIQHFSKFIPPGSTRVHVDMQAHYREPGETTLSDAYPGNLHACESSARQMWNFSTDLRLQVDQTDFCMTNIIPTGNVSALIHTDVEIWKCWETNTQRWNFTAQHQLQNLQDHQCLAFNPSTNELYVEPCVTNDRQQKWTRTGKTIQPQIQTSLCLTAGYSMLQATAVVTPENEKVLVVLNENTQSLEVDILDAPVTIPPQSIQTYRWT